MATGSEAIKRLIVRRIRSASSVTSQLRGGIHESIASRQKRFPFILYTEVSAPMSYDWGSTDNKGNREIRAVFDITAVATNQVVAENLDQLLDGLFSDKESELQDLIPEQRIINCRRVGDAGTGPSRDNEGRYHVQKGGTYVFETVQPLS